MANPFAVLGFAPAILQGLTDAQVDVLVQSQYRALSRIHHPDVGGIAENFREIVEAVKQLDQKSNFAEYLDFKENFVKVRKNRVAELERSNQQCEQMRGVLEERLIDFWKSVVAVPEEGVRVAGLRSVRILMNDTMKGAIRHKFVLARGKGQASDLLTKKMDEKLSYELEVDAQGNLTRYQLKRTDLKRGEEKPVNPNAWSYEKSNWFAERVGVGVPLPGLRLMACIGISEEVRVAQEIVPLFLRLLPGEVSDEDFDHVGNGFSFQELQAFVTWMKPVLLPKERHYLLGGRVVGEELKCVILGTAGLFKKL